MLLFQTMKQKAKFVNYISAYSTFEIKLFTDAIKLCKFYLDETHLINILGKKEHVNVQEFKDIADDSLDITIESSNGDIETKFGKVLTITQILQYAGSSMTPEQLGSIIKQLPYGNKDEIFNPLTLNYDTASNIILALDRGENPIVPKYAKVDFILDAVVSRTVKSDFTLLDQQVQQNYQALISQLEQVKSSQVLQAQQAAQGLIPASGFLTTVNASWKNPARESRTHQGSVRCSKLASTEVKPTRYFCTRARTAGTASASRNWYTVHSRTTTYRAASSRSIVCQQKNKKLL